MSGSPSGGGGHGAWHHLDGTPAVALEFLAAAAASTGAQKRKRRPAGTPDPGAEVVALSPKTLMESDRYICEICDQGFQRDQNLQMHRRRHKVPWKLLKKPSQGTPKRVYVCPERSCLHHNPAHALGDLVGIKKHFRRKHCTEKQWKCDKCSKRYAVQSDFKAHLKTCGTRGHCCGCGRVFSRVESFIEHQDACIVVKQATAHQSSGATIEKRLLPHQDVLTDKASHDSLSQSSDTTQAMSFAQSGVSERSGDSTKVPEHVLSAQPTLNAPAYKATIPPWLLNNRCRTELELLQPPDHSLSRVSDSTGGAASTTLSEDVNTPSLQLSIGSMGADTKPSPGSVEKEALALQGWSSVQKYSRSRVPVGGPRTTTGLTSSRPYLENDVDLALSIRNQGVDARGTDAVNSLKTEVLEQAAERRKDETLSSNAMDFSFRPPRKHAQQFSWNPETVVSCNPFAGGSNSLFREDRARKIHDSESSEMGFVRKGTNSHQVPPKPAISSRQTLDLMDDSGKGAQLFSNSQSKIREAIKSEKQLAEFRVDDILACEQASTDANTAWEAARSRDDQARQANEQAPREFARGDWLRRDSHEHLQLASTECELARVKRMREPDFVSRSERSATFHFQGFAFCHSCKSALHTRPLGMNHR